MNIVIKNQNIKIIDSLTIDILKTFEGQFSVSEINENLINLYYEKVIIDITAIQNYYDINSVLIFLKNFKAEDTIILLKESELINSSSFLSVLIENGYYNFTKNSAGVNFLLKNPNSLEDVEKYIETNQMQYEQKQDVDNENNYKENKTFNIDPFNLGSSIARKEIKDEEINKIIKERKKVDKNKKEGQKVIGIQNLTKHAGATTLAYMLIRQLKRNYTVKGIEMNKQDFIYFRDPDLTMCTSIDDLNLKFKQFSDVEIIILDLNSFDGSEICDDILYLIDPGLISLNKMLKKDPNIKQKTENGKIVLNRSALKDSDVTKLEYETKFKIFYNIGNVNDRINQLQSIDKFLYKLGFKKQKVKF